MLISGDRAFGEPFAVAHLRQPARFFVLRILVAAFLIKRKEAVELHHRSGGAQVEQAACDIGIDIDRGALELRRFHLARHRAQPDQLVEFGLIRIEKAFGFARPAGEVGRTDGLVGLLRVLRLGLVAARRRGNILAPVVGFNHGARILDRFGGDIHVAADK